jgi:pimeloyl-ACP methyl ester carboxylesterase
MKRPAATASPDPATVRIDGDWRHRDIYANGIRLHIAEAGSGPLVLMLHGFGEFWWAWRHQLTALAAAGFHAVAVDLRGYGDSDKPPRGYDAWTLSGDVAGLIKSLGESKAHLVGHGWGGLLTWTVAALHPRLIRSVSVLAAAHPLALRSEIRRTALRGKANNQARASRHMLTAQLPWRPERVLRADGAVRLARVFRSWAGQAWRVTPDFERALRLNQQAMQVPGVAHLSMEYYRWAVRAQLRGEGRRFAEEVDRRASMPVLQLHGAADPTLLERTARASRSWVGPRSSFQTLPGIGYFVQQEAPALTNQALIEQFLGG